MTKEELYKKFYDWDLEDEIRLYLDDFFKDKIIYSKPKINKKPIGFAKCRFKLYQSMGCKGCLYSSEYTYSILHKGCVKK